MEWKQIRAEYLRAVRAAKDRGITQAQIAAAGGLSRQSYVSKILAYGESSRGPHIMNLVGALEGVGMKVSEFFAAVEKRAAGQTPPLPVMRGRGRQEHLEREVGRLHLKAYRLAAATRLRVRRRPGKKPR